MSDLYDELMGLRLTWYSRGDGKIGHLYEVLARLEQRLTAIEQWIERRESYEAEQREYTP